MTTHVASCAADDPLSRAAQLMWDLDIGCVPVVDSRGCVVGMITDRDICMAAYTQGQPLTDIRVATAMARDPVCCTEREDVASVRRRMAARQVRRVPVVDDDGFLIGILTVADFARQQRVSAGEVAALLACIGEPRSNRDNDLDVAA